MEIGHRRGWAAAGVSFASDPAGRDREAAGGGRSGSVGDPCLGGKRASFGAKHLPGERAALGPVPWHGGTGHTCCCSGGKGVPSTAKGGGVLGQSSLASPLHQGPLFSGSRQLHFYHFSFLSRFPPICPACGPGASFQLAQPALLVVPSRARLPAPNPCFCATSAAGAQLKALQASTHTAGTPLTQPRREGTGGFCALLTRQPQGDTAPQPGDETSACPVLADTGCTEFI